MQWERNIGFDDTVIDLHFKKINPAGIESILEVCDLFSGGGPPRIPREESKAAHENWCKPPHAKIDWSKPVDEVCNSIRGVNPPHGARTTFKCKQLEGFNLSIIEGEGKPGEVVEAGDAGTAVQAACGRALAKRLRACGGKKTAAAEWATLTGVSEGAMAGD